MMTDLTDPLLKYKIAVTLIPGIGSVLAKKLLQYAGCPREIFKSTSSQLEAIPGIGKTLAGNIAGQHYPDLAEKEIEFISKYRITVLWYRDDDYPERLKHCPDSPVVLFARGNPEPAHPKILSIVGTRNAGSYGLDFCRNLVADLAARGHDPVIVSGLAYGIDICAHKAALDNGLLTIAALAHGLSTIYPPVHRNIAESITRQGALVTDFPSSILPERGNFIKRNRLIAGMADATVVIESALKGGALITADLANSYNRDVFALPGRVNDKKSQGCNKLIKTHKAALIEDVTDLEYILGWDPREPKEIEPAAGIDLTPDEKAILDLLNENPEMPADRISGLTGFGASKTSCLLLDLEFKGLISSFPGKRYALANKFS